MRWLLQAEELVESNGSKTFRECCAALREQEALEEEEEEEVLQHTLVDLLLLRI